MTMSRLVSMRDRSRLLGLLAAGSALSQPRRASATTPPSIVLIVTDDMQPSDLDVMPKTRDLLGGNGTTFPNCFAATPLCTPSRVSLLTGQLAHNHGVLGNSGGTGGWQRYAALGLGATSLPEHLRAAGYRTGLIGKFLNGAPGAGQVAPGWDRWFVQTSHQYYRIRVNDNGRGKRLGKKYSTTVLRQQAVSFIEETPGDQPLFLFASPVAPHNIPHSPKNVAKLFRHTTILPSPDFDESDLSDKPAYLRGRAPQGQNRLHFLHEHHRERLRTLLPVDDLVAGVVAALGETGRLDAAYIFFLSDNGMLLGHHRHVGKTLPYERGARTPLLARGPGFAGGAVDERLTLNIDVTATIAAVAGISPPNLDGVSLLDPAAREDVLLEWLGAPEAVNDPFYSPSAPNYSALRTAGRLYVEYDSEERELYDYDRDPHELDNLLADWAGHTPTAEAETLAQDFSARLDVLKTCAGVSCV